MQRYALVSGAVGAVFSLLVHNTAVSDYRELRVLGTSDAICADGVDTALDFQAWVLVNSDDVRAILDNAEWQGDADLLLQMIAEGRFQETLYYPGTEFLWLAARENGVPVALRKQRWAGQEPFVGFEIKVKTGDRTETVVVPKVCCNFALLYHGVEVEIPGIPPVAKPPVIEPPRASLFAGVTPFFKFTAGSETFHLAGQRGGSASPIDEPDIPVNPWSPETPVHEPDDLTPENPMHEEETLPPVEPHKPEPHKPCKVHPGKRDKKHHKHPGKYSKPQKSCRQYKSIEANTSDDTVNISAADSAATESVEDTSDTLGLRFGLNMPVTENLSLSSSVGLIGRSGIDDNDGYPDASLHLDFEVTRNIFDSWFVSGGVGAWNLEDENYSANSVFISAGSRITDSLGWFVEQRRFSDAEEGADHVTTAGLILRPK